MPPHVTVAICTHDRAADLARCLASLAAQTGVARAEWDVLVVANDCSDTTVADTQLRAAAYAAPLRVVTEPRRGLAIARNTALREARGDVVVFVDDDVTFHDGWLASWPATFQDPSVAAAGGPIQPVFPPEVPAAFVRAVMADDPGIVGHYEHGDRPCPIVARGAVAHPRGGNMALRRAVALDMGGFREDLGWGKQRIPGEETEFFQRLHRRGGTVLYVPGARVNHHLDAARTNLEYLKRWHLGYGRASVLMRPRPSPWLRVAKVCEQSVVFTVYGLRSLAPSNRLNLRCVRKRQQALGRLKQLTGF